MGRPNLITLLPEGRREVLEGERKLKGQQGKGVAWSSKALSSSEGKHSQWNVAEDPLRVHNLKGAKIQMAWIIEASRNLKTNSFTVILAPQPQ